MHKEGEFPAELAIALVLGGVVFAIVAIVWSVTGGVFAAAALIGVLFWFLRQ